MGRHFEVRQASMQKTAAAKSKIYSRYGKELYLVAKAGIPDPEMNPALKRKIAEAKSNQVPAHVIDNAIKKAIGGTGEDYKEARYEGFGPADSTLIIDCLTDNANRTIADIRAAFNKAHAKLASSGAVLFMYDQLGIFVFQYDNGDILLEKMMEKDVDVIDIEKDGEYIELSVDPNHFHNAREVLDELLGEEIEYLMNEVRWVPQTESTLNEEDKATFEKLLSLLEEVDDVQQVYHNVLLENDSY